MSCEKYLWLQTNCNYKETKKNKEALLSIKRISTCENKSRLFFCTFSTFCWCSRRRFFRFMRTRFTCRSRL